MTEIERLLDRRETLGVTLSFGDGQRDRGGASPTSASACPTTRSSTSSRSTCPETTFTTQALWYELDDDLLADDFPLEVLLGSLHAAEHAQIAVLPLLAMCDRWDIGGLSTNLHPQTGGPTIFIYDGHPGGVGITRQGFLRFEPLVADAYRLDRRVPVRVGLPVVRAVAEVRQPQRAARQGGRARGDGADARALSGAVLGAVLRRGAGRAVPGAELAHALGGGSLVAIPGRPSLAWDGSGHLQGFRWRSPRSSSASRRRPCAYAGGTPGTVGHRRVGVRRARSRTRIRRGRSRRSSR